MAWANSKIFRPFVADVLTVTALTTFGGLDADTCKVALYDDDITPSSDVTAANSAYNAGVWVTTNNEVFQAGQWAQGGVALASPAVTETAGFVTFSGANTASGSAATLTNAFGCLVYDDTVTATADRGVCYNYFGGGNSVTNGTFTIVWSANGIFRFTL